MAHFKEENLKQIWKIKKGSMKIHSQRDYGTISHY